MTIRYLLDTNVISEPLRPRPNPNTLAHLQQNQGQISIASVVWHELCFGYQRLAASARRTTIESYLNQVLAPTIPILAYDEYAAAWHAQERARLSALGRSPSFADGQIAAVAHINQLILVTFNTSDYVDFTELQLEDWRL